MSSNPLMFTRGDEPNLPEFPEQVLLEPKWQKLVQGFVGQTQPYSDFNFISLWSWDYKDKLQVSQLNGNLVVRFLEYQDPSQWFYSFLGTNKADQTAETLLKDSGSSLQLIPEVVVKGFAQAERFKIDEDRDNFDYIIGLQELAEPSGHKSSRRRSIKKFHDEYGQSLNLRTLDSGRPKPGPNYKTF